MIVDPLRNMITATNASLAGTLVIELGSDSVTDGQIINIINASSLSGIWDRAEVVGSFTSCSDVKATPGSDGSNAYVVLTVDNICNRASSLLTSIIACAIQ